MLFEGPLCLTDVLPDSTGVGVRHLGLIHDVSRLAFPIKRAAALYATVARWVRAGNPEEFSVMVPDDTGDVGHTAITDLEIAPVEYLAQFRLLWEMLIDQLQDAVADVGCDAFTKRWIEQDYILLLLVLPSIRVDWLRSISRSLVSNPLAESALSYIGAASEKIYWLQDWSETRLPIAFGRFSRILGGWLLIVCMYIGLLLSFR